MQRQEEKHLLVLKNLAHVFLDGELSGTTLEGSNLELSTSYFNEFLQWLTKSGGNEFDGLIRRLGKTSRDKTHDLDKLLKSLESLLKIEKELNQLPEKIKKTYNKDKTQLEKSLNEISQDILKTLNTNGDVYIPGGWAGVPGHQMIYRLTQEKNQILFRIYNTGAGINYHNAIPRASGKKGYYPVLGLRINNSVSQLDLQKILNTLFTFQVLPNLEPGRKFDAEDIYIDAVIGTLTWLGKKITVVPGAELSQPILGQRSGTCVFKSLTLVIREHFNDKQNYRVFLLAYRLYLLKAVANQKQIAEATQYIPDYANYLERCLANTIRMLDEDLKPKIKTWNIAITDRKAIESQLVTWQDLIKDCPVYPLQHIITQLPQEEEKISLKATNGSLEEQKGESNAVRIKKVSYNNKSFYQGLSACLTSNNYNSNDIERFCIAYANNNKLLVPEEKYEADIVLKKMSKLLEQYDFLNPSISPRSAVIYFSLMMLMDKLCEESLCVIGNQRLSCVPFSQPIQLLLKNIEQNPFLSTYDPELDALWQTVRTFYKNVGKYTNNADENPKQKKDKMWLSFLSYYVNLINQAPTQEIDIIKAHWERDKTDKNINETAVELLGEKNAYCYSFLKNIEEINNIPILKQTFRNQISIEMFLMECLKPIATKKYLSSKDEITFVNSTFQLKIEQRMVYLYHPLNLSKELFLKPALYSRYYEFESQTISNVLTSYFDGTDLTSHNVAFRTPGTNFSATRVAPKTYNTERNIITRSDLSRTESFLHQLRFAPSLLINAILSEITQHPGWLADKEYQKYIELSIFQPHLLLTELRSNTNIINLLSKLLRQNRQSDNHSYPLMGEWFMLKLAVKVANYAIEAEQNNLITLSTEVKQELLLWQQTLLQAITYRLNQDVSIEEQRRLQFLKLSVLYTYNNQEDEFLSTYLILSLLPQSMSVSEFLLNEQIRSLSEKSSVKLLDLIDKDKLNLNSLIEYVIYKLKHTDPQNIIWKASWRVKNRSQYVIWLEDDNKNSLEINIGTSDIIYNSSTLKYLPSHLILRKEYQEMFGSKPMLCRYQNKFYYWEAENNTSWRYAVDGSDLEAKSNDKWYVLTAPTQILAKTWNYNQVAFNNKSIYPLFNQYRYRVWVNYDSDYFITDITNNEKIYEYYGSTLSRLVSPKGVVKLENKLPAVLLRLETKNLIQCIVLDNNEICWHLPRYNLSFIENKSGELQTLDKRFRVSIPTATEDTFGSGVIFNPLSENEDQLYVIPIQRYCTDKNPPKKGAQYVWLHDLTNQLAVKTLEGNSDFKGWDFENSEQVAIFTYKHNKIDVSKASFTDKLYLAYLYLAQDQAENAFEILSTNKFQNTPAIIELLWWINTQLPVGKDLSNSRVVAVKMLAYQIIIDLMEQNPDILADSGNEHAVSATALYRKIVREQLVAYVNSIAFSASNHYSLYDNLRNNIPSEIRLNKPMEEWLLAYCYKAINKADLKKLEELKKNQLSQDFRPTPLEELGTRYFESFPTDNYKMVSQYQNTNITSLSTEIDYVNLAGNTYDIPANLQKYFTLNINNNSITNILSELSPWISLEILIKNFTYYYNIAKHSSANDVISLKSALVAIINLSNLRNKASESKTDYIYKSALAATLMIVAGNPKLYSNYIADVIKYKQEPNLLNICAQIRHDKGYFSETSTVLLIDYQTSLIEHKVIPKAKPIATLSLEAKSIAFAVKDPLQNTQFADLKHDLQMLQAQFESKRDNILSELKQLESKDLNLKQQDDLLFDLDNSLLAVQNNLHNTQIKLFEKYQPKLNSDISKLTTILHEMHNEKTNIAHEIEATLNKRTKPIIKELGKQKAAPTVKSLARNYAINTIDDYKHMGFNAQDISKLLKLLENYIGLHDSERRLEILLEELSKNNVLGVITAILSKNEATQRHDAIFQYIEKLALRPMQARMLKLLVQSDRPELLTSQVLQLIMGGGKTKVIMPILLNILADGDSLPVAIFPDMLLHTNYSDISTTANKVFQQDSFLFQFHRNSPVSPSDLQYIYERFESAMRNKLFMSTSIASIQSLGLKYVEILDFRTNPDNKLSYEQLNETNEQLKWLEKILILLNTKGKAVIDEAHQLLHIRKELNYAAGKVIPINQKINEASINLFTWLNKVTIPEGLLTANPCSFSSILANPNLVGSPEKITLLMVFYINSLIKPSTQPAWLQTLLINKLTPTDLKSYLISNFNAKDGITDLATKKLEDKIYMALEKYPDIKADWILLREQFTTLLPLTLQKKLHENYGPSLNQMALPFAIPYRANNTPTPFVFANFMEIINYTSQMFYADGISMPTFIATLRDWQNIAEKQRQQEGSAVSEIEVLFNRIFKNTGHQLQTLDLNNNILLADLHAGFEKNQLLIQEVLKSVLNKIALDSHIFRCDSLNAAGMFLLVYAFSGTPSNYRTYHPKIIMSQQSSLLIESQIIHYLQTQQTPIILSASEKAQPAERVDLLINQALFSQPNSYALIDCGGHLRGLNNFQTAERIAAIAKGKRDLRYILFYQEDSLYAYDTAKDKTQTPIKLSNTDPNTIKNELNNCLPNERFTYYDQEHTTGSDIRQDPKAIGVVTVDLQTGISTFLQAVGRMRELNNSQKIIIVLSPELEYILQSANPLSHLLDLMRTNQRLQLEIDHFQAALKSIRNYYREDLLLRLYNQSTSTDRDKLFIKSAEFFIEKPSDDIIKLYQQRSELQEIGIIMETVGQDQRKQWLAAVSDQPPALIKHADKILAEKILLEVKKAKLICKPKEAFPPPQWGKQVQAQQQTQTQAQLQQQKQQENERGDYYLSIKSFNFTWINKVASDPDKIFFGIKKHYAIDTLISEAKTDLQLEPHIYATEDFLQHTTNQKLRDFNNITINPQPCVFFAIDPKTNNIAVLLLSAEEAGLLDQTLNSHMREYCWFSSLNGHVFQPLISLKPELQSKIKLLLEQTAFLCGRLDSLNISQNIKWLREDTDRKFKFFRRVIQPAYGISENDITMTENNLMVLEYAHIKKWADPEIEPAEFNTWKLSLSNNLKKRFDKIFPYLDTLRTTAIINNNGVSLQQLTDDGIIENDANLVLTYSKSLMSNNDFNDTALYILKNPQMRIRQFINACFDNIPQSLIKGSMVANALHKNQPELEWLRILLEDMVQMGMEINFNEPWYREIFNFLYDSHILDTFNLKVSYSTKKLAALISLWKNNTTDIDNIKALLKKPDLSFVIRLAEHNALDEKVINQILKTENLLLPQFNEYLLILANNNLLSTWAVQKLFQDENIWPATKAFIESRIQDPKVLLTILQDSRFAYHIARICEQRSFNTEDLAALLTSSVEKLEILNNTLKSLQDFGFPINEKTIAAANKPALNKALAILYNISKSPYTMHAINDKNIKDIINFFLDNPYTEFLLNKTLIEYCLDEKLYELLGTIIKSATPEEMHYFLQQGYFDRKVASNLTLLAYLNEIDPTILINIFERTASRDLLLQVNYWLTSKIVNFTESPELFQILIDKDPFAVLNQNWDLTNATDLIKIRDEVKNYITNPAIFLNRDEQAANKLLHYLESSISFADSEAKEEKTNSSNPWLPTLNESRRILDSLIIQEKSEAKRDMYKKSKNRILAMQIRTIPDLHVNALFKLQDVLSITKVTDISNRDAKYIFDLIIKNNFELAFTQFVDQYRNMQSENLNKVLFNQVLTLFTPTQSLFNNNYAIYKPLLESFSHPLLKKLVIYAILISDNTDSVLKNKIINCFNTDFTQTKLMFENDIKWNLQATNSNFTRSQIENQLLKPINTLLAEINSKTFDPMKCKQILTSLEEILASSPKPKINP